MSQIKIKEDERERRFGQEPKPPNDVEENKGLAVVAYILFFIPLLVARHSRFAIYHANQGLLLLITAILIYTAGLIIPIIGLMIIIPIGCLFIFILWLIGILNVIKGEMNPLPLIGHYQVIKMPQEG
ncbi:hypothetical protein [Alkalibacillus aidingensis]|uniref:hypothetical protein n=1 Tax=Alkalibacillus aidingensis TaxID=2747607 RepID=UPI002948BED7|nr:hypothetical protein [Alkalibacillus aidingensis]